MKIYSVVTINKEWVIEDRGEHDFRIYEHGRTVLTEHSLNLLGQYRREDIRKLVDKLHEILRAEDEPVDAEKDCIPAMKRCVVIDGVPAAVFGPDFVHLSKKDCISSTNSVQACIICGHLLAESYTYNTCLECTKEGFSKEK